MIMKKQLLASALALIVSGACNTAGATTGKPVDWSYTAPIGAENWGGLSSEYEGCTSGQAQSPIAISVMRLRLKLPRWRSHFKLAPLPF
ncbi:hypothetical protein [Pseudomonas gregormendelii]|uniref:hypothetical protein n=1 Tax=Pseudomonas gregormendelii TaxID=1628277 RepID=UPI001F175712|nr:hypothetical protein [Pseudomonas gregormendelii]